MGEKVEIRLATKSECIDILSEPRLFKALYLEDRARLIQYVIDTYPKFYLARYQKYSLVFTFLDKGLGVYEFHVACPKASVRASRLLAKAAMHWVFKEGAPEAKALTTRCPEGKIANMCRKSGGIEVKQDTKQVYFVYFREQVK